MRKLTAALTATSLLSAVFFLWHRSRRAGSDVGDGVLDADQARTLYDRLAPTYDLVASAYALLGARRLHRRAVREVEFPPDLGGVIATFALEMVPDYDAVVARAVAALRPSGRIAVSGLRRPDGWPEWAVRLGEFVNRPFGVSRAYEAFQPWEAVRRHAREIVYAEAVLGAVYLSVGEASTDSSA